MTDYHLEKEIEGQASQGDVQALLSKPVNCSLLFDTIMAVFGQEVAKLYRPGQQEIDPAGLREQISGARVLLVEDNPLNQQVGREILEGVGLIVTMANHGGEAVEMVTMGDFDAVLMDVQMPVMDGYTATQQIRKNPRFVDLPIIAMTAHAMTGDREKSLAAGMNDHVVKPIAKKELFAALMKWIKARERATISPQPLRRGFAEEEASGLPDTLPGIDLPAAMERINHNGKLFRRLLLEFHRDYAGVAEKIHTFLAGRRQGDWESAGRMVHSLKGLAGNLSAHTLFHAAQALETAMSKGPQEVLPAVKEHFDHSLQQVVAGIAAWVAADAAGPSAETELLSVDGEILAPIVRELDGLLSRRNVKALGCFATLQASLAGVAMARQELKRLEESLARYDFVDARMVLSALAQTLGVSWKVDNG